MTDTPYIREGSIRTIEEIMPVMQTAFDPAFGEAWTADQSAGFLTLPGSILFVSDANNIVSGFALARYVFEEAELLLIAVHPDHQGQGIGKLLIRKIIGWSKNNGVKTLFLEVRSGNQALELYLHSGFVKIGTRKDYYRGQSGEYHDAITLRLDINV
jgi:ribosomal-protein-alanine N-acetyltransferase